MPATAQPVPARHSPQRDESGLRRLLAAAATFLARAGVTALFWWSAFFDILPTWPDTVDYVAAHGIPLPAAAAVGALAIEIGGPVLLFVPRLEAAGALLLAAYCLATAGLFHTFWLLQGEDRTAQLIHFLKNIALAAALLRCALAALGDRRAPTQGRE